MKAALNEVSAFRYEIHVSRNFPKRKWQNSWRDGIEHSFGQRFWFGTTWKSSYRGLGSSAANADKLSGNANAIN